MAYPDWNRSANSPKKSSRSMDVRMPPLLILDGSSYVPEEFPAMVLRTHVLSWFPSFLRPGSIKLRLIFKSHLRKMNLGILGRFTDS